jgi:ribosome-associated toxin RatA of RatAB toxin-antitoxin module
MQRSAGFDALRIHRFDLSGPAFPAGPAHQFASAIRTNAFHFVRTIFAKDAFVGTNVSFAAQRQFAAAPLALCSHFQRHAVSNSAKFIVSRTIGATAMHKTNSIIMHAPRAEIFETAADLELWPKILPHYRYIKYLERGTDRNVVIMAATRSGIPISWRSEQIIDREKFEVRFYHLKAFTKGMFVVWSFKETPAGVLVEIAHDLNFRVTVLAPLAEPIIGDFFIHHIANRTLQCMKAYLETKGKNCAA